MMNRCAWVSCVFVSLWSLSLADLPVDCEHHDIIGKWTFEVGPLDCDKSVQCHSGKALSVDNYGSTFLDDDLGSTCSFETRTKLQIELSDPFHAVVTHEDGKVTKGRWTMVYNEAFEIKMDNGRSFLAFSMFDQARSAGEPDKKGCDQTWPGRTMDLNAPDSKTWGCFVGYKAGSESVCAGGTLPKRGLSSELDTDQVHYWEDGSEITSLLEVDAPHHLDNSFYKHDAAFLASVNDKAAGGWTAGRYPELEKMTLLEVKQRMGIRRRQKRSQSDPESAPPTERATTVVTPEDLKKLGLPAHFDWRDVDGVNYVDDVISQICGSCYAAATMSQINCRTRIATNNKVKAQFDYKQILECDRYNQGCAGGYPYLALKYALEFGVSESDEGGLTPKCQAGALPHTDNGDPVDTDGYTRSEPVVRVTDYDYIGGYYGGVTAGGILEDVFKRGPVSVGIGGSLELLHYQGGVYKPTMTEHLLYDFEAVGHAVVVVGWVTSEDGKEVHYIVKNSYGADWGEQGYFRTNEFLAGEDSEHIESLVASGRVELVSGGDVSGPKLESGAGAEAGTGKRIKTKTETAKLRLGRQKVLASTNLL